MSHRGTSGAQAGELFETADLSEATLKKTRVCSGRRLKAEKDACSAFYLDDQALRLDLGAKPDWNPRHDGSQHRVPMH